MRLAEITARVQRARTETDVERAMSAGPRDTRGGLRGLCVRRFSDNIRSLQWERIQFAGRWRAKVLEMGDLFEPGEVRACMELFESAASPEEALATWNARKDAS